MPGYEFTHKGKPLKKGSRLQVFHVGEGLFAPVSSRTKMSVFATGIAHKDHIVTAVKLRGRRKPMSLEYRLTMAPHGCLVLLGWQDDIQVDADSRTGWVGDGRLNLWNPQDTHPGTVTQGILDRLVFCNLKPGHEVRLYTKDRTEHIDLTGFMNELPRHSIPGFSTAEMSLTPDPFTEAQKKQLMQEEQRLSDLRDRGEEAEHGRPMFKLFKTGTACTWLVYSMEDDQDTMWVVADLGLDCVEFGTASLKELRQKIFGTGNLERDKFFDPDKVVYGVGDLIRLDHMPSNLYDK